MKLLARITTCAFAALMATSALASDPIPFPTPLVTKEAPLPPLVLDSHPTPLVKAPEPPREAPFLEDMSKVMAKYCSDHPKAAGCMDLWPANACIDKQSVACAIKTKCTIGSEDSFCKTITVIRKECLFQSKDENSCRVYEAVLNGKKLFNICESIHSEADVAFVVEQVGAARSASYLQFCSQELEAIAKREVSLEQPVALGDSAGMPSDLVQHSPREWALQDERTFVEGKVGTNVLPVSDAVAQYAFAGSQTNLIRFDVELKLAVNPDWIAHTGEYSCYPEEVKNLIITDRVSEVLPLQDWVYTPVPAFQKTLYSERFHATQEFRQKLDAFYKINDKVLKLQDALPQLFIDVKSSAAISAPFAGLEEKKTNCKIYPYAVKAVPSAASVYILKGEAARLGSDIDEKAEALGSARGSHMADLGRVELQASIAKAQHFVSTFSAYRSQLWLELDALDAKLRKDYNLYPID